MGGLFKGKEKLNLFYNPLMLIKLPDSSEELKTKSYYSMVGRHLSNRDVDVGSSRFISR